MKGLAKKEFKKLKIGSPNGPPKYTDTIDNLEKLGLNQREQEALNLNFGALWVA